MALDMRTYQFSIGQVALFLDQTTGWLRWRENEGFLQDERGNLIGSRRANNKQGGGDRVYSLENVRQIAQALHRKGVLDDRGLEVVEQRVRSFMQPVVGQYSKNGKAS